jgi:hypothetical protein
MQKPFNAGQILCIYWSFSVSKFEILDGFSRSTKEFSAEIVFEKFLMI